MGVATLAAPEMIGGEPAWQITGLSLVLIAIAILKLRSLGHLEDDAGDRRNQSE
ncbi:MAG TPA: hypothetical protein VGM36_05310 [Rhizomicrobium sp.]